MSTGQMAPARRIRRPQLPDEVAAHVRGLIVSGELRSGQFIRVESLADELGVSATPVREGLLALRGEGFLRLEPRRGFVVAPLSSKDITDLFTAQALLAGELAARAAGNITEEGRRLLHELQDQMRRSSQGNDLDELEELNHQFHRLINRLAAAPKIAWLLAAAVRYVPRRRYPTIKGWPEATIDDHQEILRALEAGDADTARAAMHAHIINAGALLAEHFDTPHTDH